MRVDRHTLPRFVLDLLAACPSAGTGVHHWLFRITRVLHPFYEDKQEMVALIAGAVAGCGREVPHAEIEQAVANSRSCAWQPGAKKLATATPSAARPAWPTRNEEQIEAVMAASAVTGLCDLRAASPERFFDAARQVTEELVDALFPGNPLLCCGAAARSCGDCPAWSRPSRHNAGSAAQ